MKNVIDIARRLDELENEFPESLKGYMGLQSSFLNLPELNDSLSTILPPVDVKEVNLQRLTLLPDLAMALAVAIDVNAQILNGFHRNQDLLNGHTMMEMIHLTSENIHNDIAKVTRILEDNSPHTWAHLHNTIEQTLNDHPTWEAWEGVLQVFFIKSN